MWKVPLVLFSWFSSKDSVLDVCELVANFLVDHAGWRHDKFGTIKEKVFLKSTWTMDGKPIGGHLLDIYSREHALQQIQNREVGTLKAGFPGSWRDPHVAKPEIYNPWAINVKVSILDKNEGFYRVEIIMDMCTLWFASQQYAAELSSESSVIQKYLESGYKLFKKDPPDIKEQTFLPNEELLRQNREKVCVGIAQYLKHFSPLAAVLSYGEKYQYNRRKRSISPSNKIETLPPLYYLTEGVSITNKIIEEHESYFCINVEGVDLYLEEEHYGFLRE